MKLSHLSLAVLSAIALSACGGGGSSNQPVDPPKEPITPVEPADPNAGNEDGNENIEKDKVIDPTQTGVVGKLDFKTESSVGTTQYLREEHSQFDRVNNPDEETVATSILGVTLNEQNPALTNIALAKFVNDKDIVKLVQYLGNEGRFAPEITRNTSLQQQNKHNVSVPGNDTVVVPGADVLSDPLSDAVVFDWATHAGSINAQLTNVEEYLKLYKAAKTLTASQKANQKVLLAAQSQLQALKKTLEKDSDAYKGYFILDKDSHAIKWGDYIPTKPDVIDMTNSTVMPVYGTVTFDGQAKFVSTTGTGPISLGLVGMNFQHEAVDPASHSLGVYPEYVQGTEENSRSTTRILGRNFQPQGLKAKFNSYVGATSVVKSANITGFPVVGADLAATDGQVDTTVNANSAGLKYSLAVEPMQLENVQYGRVTGDLDPMDLTDDQLADSKTYYKPVPFLKHADEKAVDTYFYRGPNATTIAQMEGLKGKEFLYKGHALMYGIDNKFHGNKTTSVPNAFGVNGKYGVGNFVRATFDVDANRVKDGIVYNVWHDEKSPQQVEDVLVTFDGNVFGNTVLGEAQRIYNKSDKADFRASFFGASAQEMGGSFNSTTWQERYGADGDVWGGVFGAQRFDLDPATQLSNQQLGDIPVLTKPVNQAGAKKGAQGTPSP